MEQTADGANTSVDLLSPFRWLASVWTGFWFKKEDRSLSLAMCRIFVGITLVLSLLTPGGQGAELNFIRFFDAQNPALYHPVGLWQLLGTEPPSRGLVTGITWTGYISALLMVVGLLTRVSMAVAVVSSCFLFALLYCYRPMWAHGYNTGLLALVAIGLFSRAGDRLSVDSWLRKLRGKTFTPTNSHRWAVILVQIAVTTVFFNAAFWKLEGGGFTFDWALSDNFRNQLWHRFPWMGQDTPALATIIMGMPILYKGLAVGNLFSQTASLLSAFLLERPYLRAFVGTFFVFELLGLNFLMQLNFLHWLPLYAIFIDWERVANFFGRGTDWQNPANVSTTSKGHFAWANFYIVAFLTWSLFLAFQNDSLHMKWSTYPFSSYSMFSGIRAKEPYNLPQSYEDVAARYNVIGNQAAPKNFIDHLNRRHKSSVKLKIVTDIREKLIYIKTLAKERVGPQGFVPKEIHLDRVLLQVAPHPAKPETSTLVRGRIGVLLEDDSVVTLVGVRGGNCAKSNVDNKKYKICQYNLDWAGYDAPEITLTPINLLGEKISGEIEWIDEKTVRHEYPRDRRFLMIAEVRDARFPGEVHKYLLGHTSSA